MVKKVSVITYVYCDERNGRLPLLKEAIESVANQNFGSYEHVIVDDGSIVDIKPMLSNYKNISYYRKKRTGITNSTTTFNYGFGVAKGEYCIILPSDDMQCKRTLSTLSGYLDSTPSVGLVLGAARVVRGNGSTHVWRYRGKGRIRDALLKKNYVNACAVMFRRNMLSKIEMPPDSSGFAADYDLWLRLSEVGVWNIISDIVVVYRQVSDSTRNKTRKDMAYRKRCLDFVHRTARERRLILVSRNRPSRVSGPKRAVPGSRRMG